MTDETPGTPMTPAGRMLNDEIGDQLIAGGTVLEHILAIEAQARERRERVDPDLRAEIGRLAIAWFRASKHPDHREADAYHALYLAVKEHESRACIADGSSCFDPDCPKHSEDAATPDHTVGGEERERCPDCGHPHLPMPRPHRLPSGLLVDPVCDWPMGPESCACRRRATPRPR